MFERGCRQIRSGAQLDVLVLGAGPAGLAIAAELAGQGLSVVCLDPDPARRWDNTYAAWRDDVAVELAARTAKRTWRRALVRFDEGPQLTLDRDYLLFDNIALRAELLARLSTHGGQVAAGRATRVLHDDAGVATQLAEGTKVRSRLVVDACGASSPFTRRPAAVPAFQTAFGAMVRTAGHGFAADEMTLMDFSGVDQASSFLYALPMNDDVLFAEETCLVGRPAMGQDELERRLFARLRRMNIGVDCVIATERCRIPMGIGVPPVQPTVPFGAAAAFTHPATGYQVGRALRLAPRVALAVAESLDGGDPRDASEAAFEAMWPGSSRRAWAIYTFGMELLRTFDSTRMQNFMTCFFRLPQRTWGGYMSGRLSVGQVADAMVRVFADVDPSLKRTLIRATAQATARPLWRALTIGGV